MASRPGGSYCAIPENGRLARPGRRIRGLDVRVNGGIARPIKRDRPGSRETDPVDLASSIRRGRVRMKLVAS